MAMAMVISWIHAPKHHRNELCDMRYPKSLTPSPTVAKYNSYLLSYLISFLTLIYFSYLILI